MLLWRVIRWACIHLGLFCSHYRRHHGIHPTTPTIAPTLSTVQIPTTLPSNPGNTTLQPETPLTSTTAGGPTTAAPTGGSTVSSAGTNATNGGTTGASTTAGTTGSTVTSSAATTGASTMASTGGPTTAAPTGGSTVSSAGTTATNGGTTGASTTAGTTGSTVTSSAATTGASTMASTGGPTTAAPTGGSTVSSAGTTATNGGNTGASTTAGTTGSTVTSSAATTGSSTMASTGGPTTAAPTGGSTVSSAGTTATNGGTTGASTAAGTSPSTPPNSTVTPPPATTACQFCLCNTDTSKAIDVGNFTQFLDNYRVSYWTNMGKVFGYVSAETATADGALECPEDTILLGAPGSIFQLPFVYINQSVKSGFLTSKIDTTNYWKLLTSITDSVNKEDIRLRQIVMATDNKNWFIMNACMKNHPPDETWIMVAQKQNVSTYQAEIEQALTGLGMSLSDFRVPDRTLCDS